MNAKAMEAIKNYRAAEVPSKEDREAARDFIISVLHDAGESYADAIKLLRVIESAEWNDGWSRGYGSAKATYTPRFSLGAGS